MVKGTSTDIIISGTIAGLAEHTIGHVPRTVIDYKQFYHSRDINFYRVIYNQGGIPRFFKGIVPMLSGVSLAHVSLFTSLEYSKRYNQGIYSDTFFGVIGRVSHDIFMLPGDTIRMRSNITNGTTLDTIKNIYTNFGFKGFYRGFGTSLFMTIPTGVVEFGVHNHLERKFGSDGFQPLVTGLVTGISSSLVVSPLDTIKTCIQCDRVHGNNYNGFIDTIRKIHSKRGLTGFFRGSGLRCLQTTACFTVYDILSR